MIRLTADLASCQLRCDRLHFSCSTAIGDSAVPNSVLDAIKMGIWDFEPEDAEDEYDSTEALPGTNAKLDVLAKRVKQGLPLWHPEDRRAFDDADED